MSTSRVARDVERETSPEKPQRTGREVQPVAYPDAGLTPANFRVVYAPVREPEAGEVLVRNTSAASAR
jgi:hypothetical protein